MTTIIINEKTKKGRILLELIREIGVGKIVSGKTDNVLVPNQVTLDAIKEAEKGNVIRCKSFDDYLAKVK
jgi:hypothetical protein